MFCDHSIGTVPWLWSVPSVAPLALNVAGRKLDAGPGWLTRTSLVLGGLTTPLVISPRQCTAGMTGRNWLTAATIGPLKRA